MLLESTFLSCPGPGRQSSFSNPARASAPLATAGRHGHVGAEPRSESRQLGRGDSGCSVAVLQCCSAVTLRTEGSRAGASVGGRSGRAGPGCLQAGEDDDNGGVDDERHRVALGGVDEDEDVSEEDETDEQQQVREVVVAEGHLEVLDLRPPARGRAGADTSRHRFICILSYFL